MEVALDPHGLDHVVQLAKQVDEVDCLMAEVLETLCLFFVEVLHLIGGDNLVVVQVDDFKPVVKCLRRWFILLAKHEVYKVLVAHLTFHLGLKFTWHLIENSVHCLAWQSVAFILWKVFFVNLEVVIGVQLPKAAVQNVKMLIRKVQANFVDVVFCRDLMQDLE